jgi:hypothetical protein
MQYSILVPCIGHVYVHVYVPWYTYPHIHQQHYHTWHERGGAKRHCFAVCGKHIGNAFGNIGNAQWTGGLQNLASWNYMRQTNTTSQKRLPYYGIPWYLGTMLHGRNAIQVQRNVWASSA